jgi:hypothetical protein
MGCADTVVPGLIASTWRLCPESCRVSAGLVCEVTLRRTVLRGEALGAGPSMATQRLQATGREGAMVGTKSTL